MTRSLPPISPNAVAWALLSQAIWLPLVAIDAHDRWQARIRSLTPPTDSVATAGGSGSAVALPKGNKGLPTQVSDPVGLSSTGLVLGSASRSSDPLLDGPIEGSIEQPAARGNETGHRPWSPATIASMGAGSVPSAAFGAHHAKRAIPAADPLQRAFTRSELLGGTLTLNDVVEPVMPAMARAERARWAGSGDPMAPLPQPWREPIRKALRTLPNAGARVVPARVVHVPSSKVTRSTPVPLALQSDGTVDILSRPDNPAVVKEIEAWSGRQSAPEGGAVAPAIVHLEPLPPEPNPAEERTVSEVPAAAPITSAAAPAAEPVPAVAPAESAADSGVAPAP
jgi:hypothetical protein